MITNAENFYKKLKLKRQGYGKYYKPYDKKQNENNKHFVQNKLTLLYVQVLH